MTTPETLLPEVIYAARDGNGKGYWYVPAVGVPVAHIGINYVRSDKMDELREKYDKLVMAVNKTMFWEKSGAFISGVFGKDQDTGTPEGVFICPAYGADHQCTQAYWRNDVVKDLRAKLEAADGLVEALEKVISVSDRKTIEYDEAKQALAKYRSVGAG